MVSNHSFSTLYDHSLSNRGELVGIAPQYDESIIIGASDGWVLLRSF